MYADLLFQTFPGFLSLRDSSQRIVFLNQNFRNWIAEYTDVDPLGKTNVELAQMVPWNVADTFMQCHDASLDLQHSRPSQTGLKKVLEFKSDSGQSEDSQYFDTFKYRVVIEGEPHIFTIAYDVTDLYLENRANQHSAVVDALTGAFNRRYFELNSDMLYGHMGALVDLDNFKMINDLEGHHVGDAILTTFVDLLQSSDPGIIAVIRIGGDEFLVISSNAITEDDLRGIMESARVDFERASATYRYLSFSFGLGSIGYDLEETIKRLDEELYKDKLHRKVGKDALRRRVSP